MPSYFMYGTSLQEYEQMMMSVPKFLPRTKGMIIMGKKAIDEKEEFKKCIYCTEYSKGGCQALHCPYLLERASFGQIGYGDFIKDCFGNSEDFYFKKRLRMLIRGFTGEWFLSPYHKDRYSYLTQDSSLLKGNRNKIIAILFLLSSDEQLWQRAKDHIHLNKIALNEIPLADISTNGYALYKAAKTIAYGKSHILSNELADKELIGDFAFKAIINAFLIARYGRDILSVKR